METLFILLAVVVAPIWIIFHYVTIWKKQGGITAEDQDVLSTLKKNSEKLEQRLDIMERILDEEVPDWRHKSHEHL